MKPSLQREQRLYDALQREQRLYDALKRITKYASPDNLRRTSEKAYGLPYEEALEYAYENVLNEARSAIKGSLRSKGNEQ